MIDRKKLFKDWCKKLTQTLKELEEEYQKRIEQDKKQHPDLTDKERDKYIISVMQGHYKRQFMSRSKKFEGVVIGVMPKFDTVINIRKTALEIYEKDPERAVEEGFTDDEGNPIYLSPEWRKGRIVPEHSYNRGLIVVAFQPDGTTDESKKFRPYILNMRGDKADLIPPIFKKVTFRSGISKDGKALNSSSVTEFRELDGEVEFTDILKLIKSHFVPLNTLGKWCDENKDENGRIDFNKFIITRGNVSSISPINPPTYSRERVVLTSLDLGFIKEDSEPDDDSIIGDIVCWIPNDVPQLNFGEGSEVYMIGRPAINDESEVSLNVLGFWADPKYSTSPSVPPQKVDKNTIQPPEESESIDSGAKPTSEGQKNLGDSW